MLARFPIQDIIRSCLNPATNVCVLCWPRALWKQYEMIARKYISKYISRRVPAASCSHPHGLDSTLPEKRTTHLSNLAALNPPNPTGLPAAGRGAWFTPHHINHHLHSCPRWRNHWKSMRAKGRLGRQVCGCIAGLLGDIWRFWETPRTSKATQHLMGLTASFQLGDSHGDTI